MATYSFASTGAAHASPAVLGVAEVGGAVRCIACAHRCLIRPGRAGICHVRENRDGALVSLVYGQAVAASAFATTCAGGRLKDRTPSPSRSACDMAQFWQCRQWKLQPRAAMEYATLPG